MLSMKLKLKFPAQLYVCWFEMMFLAYIFFHKKEKLHKSHFLCDGQGHNALFTHWTDVTLFSAIRTHKGHLGHAKQENTYLHAVT